MNPVSVAGSFADEIRQRAAAIEAARQMPDDLAARMSAAGLFQLLVPEAYGGLQVTPQTFFDTLQETARADGAVGWCQMIAATTGMMAASLPDEWSRTIYGNEQKGSQQKGNKQEGGDRTNITSGVTAPLGRAVAVDGGLMVNGRWPFGSGSQISQWICGGCLVLEDGEPRKNRFGDAEALLVFFPADEVVIHDTWHTLGLCGTGSNDIEVRDLFVPAERWVTLGARARIDAPLYRFPTFGLLALGVSAVALGIAQHAIEAFVELAASKVPTGSSRTLGQRSSTHKDLARAMAAVNSARAMTTQAIAAAWAQVETTHRLSTAMKADLRLAATNNAWSAAAAVDLLYHAAGGSSIYHHNDLQRCFRDIHVATQHIMVAQPTFEMVGKVALGIDPNTPL
jgi:alkylation response protein AidB-like acyl-CoA dehydrogenase